MTLDCIVKPAGLRAPSKQRSVVQEDNCSEEISGLFEKYLAQVGSKEWDDSYLVAEGMVRHLDLSDQGCIDAFIISHQDEKIVTDFKTGIFISALYNCLRQDVIVFDHDLPIDHLGFRLSQSKRLFVNGSAGDGCGYYSSGLVLVSGRAGEGCGSHSSGLVLVSGRAGDWCGWCSSGLVLVSGRAGDRCGFCSSGLVLVSGTVGDNCGGYSSGLVLVSGSAGKNCGEGSSGAVVECENDSIKDWGSTKKLYIRYDKLVKNKALHNYLKSIIQPVISGSLSIEALRELPRPKVKSVLGEIRRLYRP